MTGARILVVDDEPMNLEIIAEYLDDSGYQLTSAASGEEAWAVLDRSDPPFDLLVLDRMMPGMDGLELLGLMRADSRFQTIPVILQTAAASPDQIREGLAAGAAYYLTKPFEPESLLTIVRSVEADLRERRELHQRLERHSEALAMVQRAEFEVRTLDEAHGLAALLAGLCAEPEMAVMGLSELLVNGIEHGNLGISFEEKGRLRESDTWLEEIERRLADPAHCHKRVFLSLLQSPEDWIMVIEDQGKGFNWQEYLELSPERAFAPNGRGIALARQLAFTEITYEGRGNRVKVRLPRKQVTHSP